MKLSRSVGRRDTAVVADDTAKEPKWKSQEVGVEIEATVLHFGHLKAQEKDIKAGVNKDKAFIMKYFEENGLDKFEIDKTRLTAHLRLLWDRGLIEEERFDDNQTYFLVTPRGKTVLKVVRPIIKEAHKIQMREYDYLSNTLEGAGYK